MGSRNTNSLSHVLVSPLTLGTENYSFLLHSVLRSNKFNCELLFHIYYRKKKPIELLTHAGL